jgi:hypothetical protein
MDLIEMETVILLAIGVLAASLGIALGRYVWPSARGGASDLLAKAQTELARFEQECTALRSRTNQLNAEYKAAAVEAKAAGEDSSRRPSWSADVANDHAHCFIDLAL